MVIMRTGMHVSVWCMCVHACLCWFMGSFLGGVWCISLFSIVPDKYKPLVNELIFHSRSINRAEVIMLGRSRSFLVAMPVRILCLKFRFLLGEGLLLTSLIPCVCPCPCPWVQPRWGECASGLVSSWKDLNECGFERH